MTDTDYTDYLALLDYISAQEKSQLYCLKQQEAFVNSLA